jgi:hypothetical protein
MDLWHPDRYQSGRTRPAFEGWYFKITDAEGRSAAAVIPGISRGKRPSEDHAFIQVIRTGGALSAYHRFPIEEFRSETDRFRIGIGNNQFGSEGFLVRLDGLETEVRFTHSAHWKRSLFAPGIMGPFSYVPFMECYHGLVCANADVSGVWTDRIGPWDFSGGRGYIEKDWGRSFPSDWIWMQSNSFGPGRKDSFMLSIATIPWLGGSFTGFLGFLLTEGRMRRFATWTGAKISSLHSDGRRVFTTIETDELTLEAVGEYGADLPLTAPVDGSMTRMIHECLSGTIRLRLSNAKDRTLYSGKGTCAGIEAVGKIGMQSIGVPSRFTEEDFQSEWVSVPSQSKAE